MYQPVITADMGVDCSLKGLASDKRRFIISIVNNTPRLHCVLNIILINCPTREQEFKKTTKS